MLCAKERSEHQRGRPCERPNASHVSVLSGKRRAASKGPNPCPATSLAMPVSSLRRQDCPRGRLPRAVTLSARSRSRRPLQRTITPMKKSAIALMTSPPISGTIVFSSPTAAMANARSPEGYPPVSRKS
jgi:hypothetical protein